MNKIVNDSCGALKSYLAFRDDQYVGKIERGITTGVWYLYDDKGTTIGMCLDYRDARARLKEWKS